MRRTRALSAAVTVAVGGSSLAVLGASPAQAAPESDWDALAQCESGGDWSLHAGNGLSGGLQMTDATWAAYGGTGSAHEATRAQQIAVAENVLAGQGWSAWPACSQELGLTSAAAPAANPMGRGPASSAVGAARPASGQAPTLAPQTLASESRSSGAAGFSDVSGHWAQADLDWAKANGVVLGHADGTFRPDEDVTRADFLTMLHRLSGSPQADAEALGAAFPDARGHHQAQALAWAVDEGLVSGWSDGTLRPDAPLDATALGLILHRAAEMPEHSAPQISRFADVRADLPGYPELDWLHDQGVLPAAEGSLGVGDGITRAEGASVIRAAVSADVLDRGAPAQGQAPWAASGAPAAQPVSTATTVSSSTQVAVTTTSGFTTSAQAQTQASTAVQTMGVDVSSVADGAVTADGQAVVQTAMRGLGGAYVWGGTGYKSWDCSGYVQWVYAQHGISIPRVTWDQFAAARRTTTPKVGDLVSQNNGSHVGIYLGDGLMVSALNPEQGTLIHPVSAMKVDGFYTYL